MMTDESKLVVRRQNEVTVVGFREPTLMDSFHISTIGKELVELVEKQGHRRMVLDLSTIKMISSQALGVLLTLKQKLDLVEGKIVLSGIDPRLYRVFKITNLHNVFEFYDDCEAAVSSLSAP